MYKGLVFSIVLVFLITSIALGNIGQAEGFQISTGNLVTLYGGPGLAVGGNVVIVGQNQTSSSKGVSLDNLYIALQGETGILDQGTAALSFSAALGGTQQAEIVGQQIQTEDIETSTQDQTRNFVQAITKDSGIGGIIAGQGGIIGQAQIIASSAGITGEAVFSGISQYNGIVGGFGKDVFLDSLIAMGTGQ
ncbi:MAG: hypothetical protein JW787_02230 [Sedimentisphaerales bacterium]|nr:hypothetical protein [Sedimentisphaerales bacterium]